MADSNANPNPKSPPAQNVVSSLLDSCVRGIPVGETPLLQSLSILQKLQQHDSLGASSKTSSSSSAASAPTSATPASTSASSSSDVTVSKEDLDKVLDHVLQLLTSASDLMVPKLPSAKKAGLGRDLDGKTVDIDVRKWLASQTGVTRPLYGRRKKAAKSESFYSMRDADSSLSINSSSSVVADGGGHPPSAGGIRANALRRRTLSASELTEDNAKLYRKKIQVHAFRTESHIEVRKTWGVSQCQPHDWIIISQQNDIYTCSEQVFSSTYEPVPGLMNVYRKTGTILAVRKDQKFKIHTSRGVETGNEGDYVAQSKDGEQWCVPAHVFESTYELAIDDSETALEAPSSTPSITLNPSENAEVNKLLQQALTWDFDLFALQDTSKGNALYFLGKHCFQHYGLVSKFDIHESTLERFLLEIQSKYSPNPYHNSLRAADVLHTLFMVIENSQLKSSLHDHEILACLVAAIVHDVGHPGYDKNFLVQTESEQAIAHNDRSVLEHMHCTIAFRAIKKFDIFQRMSDHQRRKVRRLVIELVLATDLSQHVELLGKWHEYCTARRNALQDLASTKQSADERLLTLKILLKTCDVAHPCKHPSFHQSWADRNMKEFFNQGDMEKSIGLSVSPFMNRAQPDQADAHQRAFIKWVTRPLFTALAEFVAFDLEHPSAPAPSSPSASAPAPAAPASASVTPSVPSSAAEPSSPSKGLSSKTAWRTYLETNYRSHAAPSTTASSAAGGQ